MKRIIYFLVFSALTISNTIAQTYHEDDKEGLRMFLRQLSAEDGRINAERLGLQISDTLNWQGSEAWIEIINKYLTWNNESPKQLIEIKIGKVFLLSTETNNISFFLTGVLDASKWSKLTTLYCENNQLSALVVNANAALTELWCNGNQLTALDVSANTALTWLDCGNNRLTVLDVSANTALKELWCYNNQLTTLDVSMNTMLSSLICYENQLTSLDVSTNTVLTNELWCNSNQLTTLKVNNQANLRDFRCNNNRLSLSELFDVSGKIISSNNFQFHFLDLGIQYMHPLTVNTGNEIDYSSQNVFNEAYTHFAVSKNGNPATSSDYTLSDGRVKFNSTGNYTVTMTNDAIFTHGYYPTHIVNSDGLPLAQVIVEIEVGSVGHEQILQNAAKIKIYPNPTHDQLVITNHILRMEDYCIYNVTGQMVMQGKLQEETTALNVSMLARGVYYLRISDIVVKFFRQ